MKTKSALLFGMVILALEPAVIPDSCLAQEAAAAQSRDCLVQVPFDGHAKAKNQVADLTIKGTPEFVQGLHGQAIRFGSSGDTSVVQYEVQSLNLDDEHDFSIQFWVRTTMKPEQRAVLLSTKDIPDNGLKSQKQKGWAFSVFGGTWAWSIGSGNRRISYDRANGEFMPINDGRWHQLSMTHSAREGLVRLYLDGKNLVTYNIKDSAGFQFGNNNPLTVGWNGEEENRPMDKLPVFVQGATDLQEMVDEFNQFGLPSVTTEEFKSLVSQPAKLFAARVERLKQQGDSQASKLLQQLDNVDLKSIEAISRRLMRSHYTVHQSRYYNEVALLFKLYRLENGQVVIDQPTARRLAQREVLTSPSFDLDELGIWKRVLTPGEILNSYSRHYQPVIARKPENLRQLTACSWNIYHGGLHHSLETEGWDSRQAIIDLLRREQVDIVMMQETYSSGDYIAAELGFYYATTIDWDNMHQGSNISVLSRFPIREILVPPKSTFMNVAARVSLSETQDIYVMSNWYGMNNFNDVFEFHKSRFENADSVPVLFAGDFNAIPDSDGGRSLASRKLAEAGFVDAYRSLYPDSRKFPGFTHRSDRRIDQLYFKGKGLRNKKTQVFSAWPSHFPSDHYLIKTVFDLDYKTVNSD